MEAAVRQSLPHSLNSDKIRQEGAKEAGVIWSLPHSLNSNKMRQEGAKGSCS
jgi:hypothetical protein